MIELDKSLFLQMINFLFLLWILNLILYRPIRRILAERKQRIDGFTQQIKQLSMDIDRHKEEIAELMSRARKEGFDRKEGLKREAAEQEARLLSDVSAESESKLAEVKQTIVQEVAAARGILQTQMQAFARELASKILGRQVG